MPELTKVVELDSHETISSPQKERTDEPSAGAAAPNLFDKLTSKRFLMAALTLASLAVFANSISGDLVHDDLWQIGKNPLLGKWDWDTITRPFTHDHWAAIRIELADGQVDSLYYRPMFGMFFIVGHILAGRDPALWHMIVLALHLLAVLLVFLVIEKSLAAISSLEQRSRHLLAAFVAGVFAVHPAQSESVAWIAGAVNPLSAIFMLSAFYSYLCYREPGAEFRIRHLGALAFFALALLTKESSLALLPVVVAYELFIFNTESAISRRVRSAMINAFPFALVAIGYVTLRHSILNLWVGRVVSANFFDDASLTALDNLRTLPALVLGYLKLAVLPFGLSLIYDFQYVRSFGAISFWAPLCFLIIIGGALFVLSKRMPEIKLALIWMVIPLAPHLNTRVFANEEILHDRYLYLSLAGVALLFAVMVTRAVESRAPIFSSRGLAMASAAVLIVLGSLTIAQNRHWKNGEAMWTNAAAHAPNSRLVHLALGWFAESRQDTETALREYEAALQINPDIVDALNNAAFVYARSGRWKEATRNFERIVSLTPAKAIAHFNLSFAYAVQRRYSDAIVEQQSAIDLDPNNERADEWRGRLDQLEKALADSVAPSSKTS